MSTNDGAFEAIARDRDGKTDFKVLQLSACYGVEEFLNRYLGLWERVDYVSDASIVVFSVVDDGVIFRHDATEILAMFDRDGTEARVYEFDPYDQQLKARTREYVQNRISK